MADNNVVEILKSVVSELKDMARSETIIGKPVTIGDKTVIPVVKISVGFGAGGGQGENGKGGPSFGGGGGGGATIEPAAFIIIDDDGYQLLPAKRGSWGDLIDAIPGFAKKLSKLKDQFTSSDDDNDDDDDAKSDVDEEGKSEEE